MPNVAVRRGWPSEPYTIWHLGESWTTATSTAHMAVSRSPHCAPFWSHVLTAFSFRVHLNPARTGTGQPGPAFPIRNSRPSGSRPKCPPVAVGLKIGRSRWKRSIIARGVNGTHSRICLP